MPLCMLLPWCCVFCAMRYRTHPLETTPPCAEQLASLLRYRKCLTLPPRPLLLPGSVNQSNSTEQRAPPQQHCVISDLIHRFANARTSFACVWQSGTSNGNLEQVIKIFGTSTKFDAQAQAASQGICNTIVMQGSTHDCYVRTLHTPADRHSLLWTSRCQHAYPA